MNISPQSHFREISNNKNTVFTRRNAGQIYGAYWFFGFLVSISSVRESVDPRALNQRSFLEQAETTQIGAATNLV